MIDHWLDLFQLTHDPHDKPRVAISACLLGEPVRYDGEHKQDSLVTGQLAPWLTVHAVCPETGIGLPVPRPPIQVVRVRGQHRVRRVDDARIDVTDALRHHANALPQPLDGLVLKARSPSCGVGTTPVYDAHGTDTGTLGNGAFADAALARQPTRPCVNETHLQEEAQRTLFLLQCHLHQALRRHGRDALVRWPGAAAQLPAAQASQLKQWFAALSA